MLSERQINILNEVIQLHTNWAKPIASSFLHKRGGFKISPATLRNEMLDLEDGGYLTHLHTSGGKVPPSGLSETTGQSKKGVGAT